MASSAPSKVIKLVILDREPASGEKITIDGETGTYIDGSAVPLDEIPPAEEIQPSTKNTMLGKKTNSDGSIIFWYLEPGAKEKWQQIPLKGFTKNTISAIPRAANYARKTQKQNKGILKVRLSPSEMVSAAINETPFSLETNPLKKAEQNKTIKEYIKIQQGIPSFRDKHKYDISPIQLNATNKQTIKNTEQNLETQKVDNSLNPNKTTRLGWNESVSKCTDYARNKAACEADKSCIYTRKGCVTKPTEFKNVKYFDKETEPRKFINSNNLNGYQIPTSLEL